MLYDLFPVRTTLCIDMKSFYASIAARQLGLDPLKACIAVVGAEDFDGSIVLAASPEMKRRFRIKTGNRRFDIPHHPAIHIVNAEMLTYLQVSVSITETLQDYFAPDDLFVYSVDEVFAAFDPVSHMWASAEEAGRHLQQLILRTTGVPSVIGIGDNMLLSKLCLDLAAKKTSSGIDRWTYADVPSVLWPHPVGSMWGIGSRSQKRLNKMGIRTVGELAKAGEAKLIREFGQAMGSQLYWHAQGVDLTELKRHPPVKDASISNGQILMRDYSYDEIKVILLEMTEEVTRRCRKAGVAGNTVGLMIGYSYDTGGGFSRTRSLSACTNVSRTVYQVLISLLDDHMSTGLSIRRVSVSLSDFQPDHYAQLNLFEPERDNEKEREIGHVMDEIRDMYGPNAILRASSYTDAGTARHRNLLIGGHRRK
ncbi:Y-family DNA polymerase [Salisediminibacterium beveridgei]|uniref:UV damage repair protein UvrX n=1 Tax=Salisediminibacterium beveridgei TaxID=632773 RepID=A0A1D7QVB8_9BACI|nr:hypothetical protein [Salisediminibacterium beveridgei]AOM82929.1 UV damage repair protein UvrX [Salisediminibacterium beveridgei]